MLTGWHEERAQEAYANLMGYPGLSVRNAQLCLLKELIVPSLSLLVSSHLQLSAVIPSGWVVHTPGFQSRSWYPLFWLKFSVNFLTFSGKCRHITFNMPIGHSCSLSCSSFTKNNTYRRTQLKFSWIFHLFSVEMFLHCSLDIYMNVFHLLFCSFFSEGINLLF